MANIATLLARILTTRYGRDMRQDLHDSIEAVNNDTENALGKKLTFTNNTRKLKLLANDDTVLSEVVISGGSGSGSVDSVNGLFPDENGNVEVNLDDINDVDITSVSNGDALVYDATSHKWVNGAGGGGTSDYSQLTNKPSVNGVTLSGNKTSGDLGIFAPTITSPTSGQVIKYDGSNWVNGSVSGGSNRNLLDNPWFTVNQRNKSGAIGVIGYFLDRWTLDSGTITIESDKTVSIGARTIVAEYIEQNVVGKQVTVSALLSDASIKKATFTVLADTYNSGSDGVLSLVVDTRSSVQSNGSKAKIVLYNTDFDNAITIQSVKLELGTESTLALDVAPNYTEELLKCQRYYVPLPRYWNGLTAGINSTYHLVNIELPTKMRAVPTISGSANIEGALNGASVMETIATSSMTVRNTDLQFIQIAVQSTNNYDKNGNVLFMPSSGAALSAEL